MNPQELKTLTAGDRVRYIGGIRRDYTKNRIYTIYKGLGDPWIINDNGLSDSETLDMYVGHFERLNLESRKDYAPHPYREEIIAWLDGYAIEGRRTFSGAKWADIERPRLVSDSFEYRVKEATYKSPEQIEREAIEAEIQALQKRLAKLEG